MKKIFAIAATAVALSALAGCYIGKAEFKGGQKGSEGSEHIDTALLIQVRQAKLGRTNS